MMQAEPLVVAPEAVEAECLELFGMPVEVFAEAVKAGWLERQTKLVHHAKNVPGQSFQAETLGQLRRLGADYGWTRRNEGSFGAMDSPDKRLSIVVRSASWRTGLGPFRPFPRCNNRNGRMLVQAVAENRRNHEPELFPPDVIPLPTKVEHEPLGTDNYLLLIHVDRDRGPTQGDIRSELSLPSFRGPDRRISGFLRRILLPTIHPNRGGTRPEQADEANIKIVRRVS